MESPILGNEDDELTRIVVKNDITESEILALTSAVISQYENDTNSKFTKKNYCSSDLELFRFIDSQNFVQNKHGSIPFTLLCSRVLQCHQGKSDHKMRLKKNIAFKLKNPNLKFRSSCGTKHIGCHALIKWRAARLYPKYEIINNTRPRYNQRICQKLLFQDLHRTEHCETVIFMKFPRAEHHNHSLKQIFLQHPSGEILPKLSKMQKKKSACHQRDSLRDLISQTQQLNCEYEDEDDDFDDFDMIGSLHPATKTVPISPETSICVDRLTSPVKSTSNSPATYTSSYARSTVDSPLKSPVKSPLKSPVKSPLKSSSGIRGEPMEHAHAMSMLANAALNATPVPHRSQLTTPGALSRPLATGSRDTVVVCNATTCIPSHTAPTFKPSLSQNPGGGVRAVCSPVEPSASARGEATTSNVDIVHCVDVTSNPGEVNPDPTQEVQQREISNVPDIDKVIRIQLMKSNLQDKLQELMVLIDDVDEEDKLVKLYTFSKKNIRKIKRTKEIKKANLKITQLIIEHDHNYKTRKLPEEVDIEVEQVEVEIPEFPDQTNVPGVNGLQEYMFQQMDSHNVVSHNIVSHNVDSHIVDSHIGDSHIVDSHIVDSHASYPVCEYIDGIHSYPQASSNDCYVYNQQRTGAELGEKCSNINCIMTNGVSSTLLQCHKCPNTEHFECGGPFLSPLDNSVLRLKEIDPNTYECQTCSQDKGLPEKDLYALTDGNWIGNEIINYYLRLISRRNQDVYTFDSYMFYTLINKGIDVAVRFASAQNSNLFQYKLLLMPICDHRQWSLVGIDIQDKTLTWYDSMHIKKKHIFRLIKSLITEMAKFSDNSDEYGWKLRWPKVVPTQTVPNDCGVFIMKYAEVLAKDGVMNFTQDDIPFLRRQIQHQIKTQCI